MSFARFLTWLTALLLAVGAGLVLFRYGLQLPSWGDDAFGMLLAAVLGTRQIQEALEDMWERSSTVTGTAAEELEEDEDAPADDYV